jgi:hypothetical protein
MQSNQPANNNGVRIILIVVIAVVVVCIVIPICTIAILALTGPQIANIFSRVTSGLTDFLPESPAALALG